MFACRDATQRMTDDREGKLEGTEKAKFRFHMFLCARCRAFRRQLDETVALVKEIPAGEVPQELEDELANAFRSRRAK
jgi:hypothetical protein